MAKGYWVSLYRKISDPNALAEYAKLAGPAIEAGGGTFIARGGRVEAHGVGVNERTVIVQFDSYDRALATYHGTAYQAAAEKLGNAVERDFRIVEALD